MRLQSGLSDDLLFFPGGWWTFPVEAAQRPPGLLRLPCPVNCNGSAGSGNKSAERRDQWTRTDGVTVCPVRHSKSVRAVPFNRASRNRSSLSCRVDVPRQSGLASGSALSSSFVYSLPVADSDRHTGISKTRAKSFSAENRPTRVLLGGQKLTR